MNPLLYYLLQATITSAILYQSYTQDRCFQRSRKYRLHTAGYDQIIDPAAAS